MDPLPDDETTRDRQRDATRKRLFDAAITIFKRDGFRAARVDDITLVAGVSRTAFYFHFPDKEDVLLAHLGEREQRIVAAITAVPAGASIVRVVDGLVAGMAKEWEDDRTLLLDALSVTLRRQSEGATLERPLLRALELRFPTHALAEQCLVALTSAASAYQPTAGRTFAEALRAAGTAFLEGVKV